MDTRQRSWAVDRPVSSSPFALPRGALGRLAGRIMLWTNKQHEIIDVLDIRPGDRVLEVGYGPGALIRLLAARTEAAVIQGVDPSPTMRDLAIKTNRAAVQNGRVEVNVGSAEHTGLPDASVDRIVSVNNVAIWPDLEAGVRELHRVVRPGGTVTIAWHGGTAPSRIADKLRLPGDKLDRIEAALREVFADVTRRRLKDVDVFRAVR